METKIARLNLNIIAYLTVGKISSIGIELVINNYV